MVRWDRQLQRVYFGPGCRWRLHHGSAGVLLLAIAGVLVWHDRRDYPWPFIDPE